MSAIAIRPQRITAVTNNLSIINLLSKSEAAHTVCTGDNLVTAEQAFCGNCALKMLGSHYVDGAILSCRSLPIENGITDSLELRTEMRRQIIRKSNKSFVVAGYTKFNQVSHAHICDHRSITAVIADRPLDQRWLEKPKADGCKLYGGHIQQQRT